VKKNYLKPIKLTRDVERTRNFSVGPQLVLVPDVDEDEGTVGQAILDGREVHFGFVFFFLGELEKILSRIEPPSQISSFDFRGSSVKMWPNFGKKAPKTKKKLAQK